MSGSAELGNSMKCIAWRWRLDWDRVYISYEDIVRV